MGSLRLLIQHYARAAWRRRWIGLCVTWLICGVGWTGVSVVPDQYESSARLFVDGDAILTPLQQGQAADPAPTSQLEMLQRSLLSRPNLEKLIARTGLDLGVSSPSDRERLLQGLAENVQVESDTRNLFTITYRATSPTLAHDVVQSLLSIFIEGATGSNHADMDNAKRFLEHQISSYEEQLRAAEERRADFRAKYSDVLSVSPSTDGLSTAGPEAASNTLRDIDGKLQDAVVRRGTLRKELDTTPAMLGQVKTKLQEAEDRLKMLLLKDTEQHPDVITQKKVVEVLRNSREGAAPSNLPSTRSDSTFDAARRPVANPAYEQLKARLTDADAEVASLERQRASQADMIARLERLQREQPSLLAEYHDMDRGYNVLRKNYEELLGRLRSADTAQVAGTEADTDKLRVVEPPQIPTLPVAPDRPLLISVVLAAGIGGGVSFTVLLGRLDQSFTTVDQLRELGLPVVGGISLLGRPPLLRRLMAAAQFNVAVLALIVVYGGLMLHVLLGAALI